MDLVLKTKHGGREWLSQTFSDLALDASALITLDASTDQGRIWAKHLREAIVAELLCLGGKLTENSSLVSRSNPYLPDHQFRDPASVRCLAVILVDSAHKVSMDGELTQLLNRGINGGVISVVRSGSNINAALSGGLEKLNAAFWSTDPAEKAGDVLAAVGLTSFDRRIFISYKRTETLALADQLHDELCRKNFQVFLDRISIDPGVDFQERLVEHLADKAMVLALDSPHFKDSKWTMEEIQFSQTHHLGLLILRLPGVTPGIVPLDHNVVEPLSPGDFETGKMLLTRDALERVINKTMVEHGRAIVHRRNRFRNELICALSHAGVSASEFSDDGMMHVTAPDASRRNYAIRLSVKPPDLPDFHQTDGSCVNSDEGVVLAQFGAIRKHRLASFDWLVKKSGVRYFDLQQIPELARNIREGK